MLDDNIGESRNLARSLMFLRYREDKTTQAAARLLQAKGGRMSYMSLIKLLYFADRRAFAELGRPISSDLFVSMPHGPVLSRTLDLVTAEPERVESYWRRYISEPEHYEVRLLDEVPNDQLSPAEEHIVDDVFHEFGHLTRWELVDRSHKLPEWKDPHGSSIPIEPRVILMAQGIPEDDVDAILEELAADEAVEALADS